jgi:thiol-disulfide isomerase/thioredoxin
MIRTAIYCTALVATVMSLFSACIVVNDPYPLLAPGSWRAILKLDYKPVSSNPSGEPLPEKMDITFEEVSAGELPFTFEVIYDTKDSFHIEIINGSERIIVDDITIGLDRRTAKDTVIIDFPVYDSYIRAIYEEDILEGDWIVKNRGTEYSIPFLARQGQNHRFTQLKKEPVLDVSGKWEATFGIDESEEPYKAIAEFEQEGNYLTGTFRTETGDYRYLQGTVQANKLYLSCFDGSHAFLFEAKINEDATLLGSFRSGKHYRSLWSAKRNESFELRQADSLTFIKEGYGRFSFEFENPDGKRISLEDDAYKGKVTIVQLLGTWCPNCRDETVFLKEYLDKNNSEDLTVIGLAFERYKDKNKANEAIRTYKEQLGLDYEIVHAGSYEKKEAIKALPMLNQIVSYPTMIFIDKFGEVRRIHTGFSGPATSTYEDFKADFNLFINELLNEQ